MRVSKDPNSAWWEDKPETKTAKPTAAFSPSKTIAPNPLMVQSPRRSVSFEVRIYLRKCSSFAVMHADYRENNDLGSFDVAQQETNTVRMSMESHSAWWKEGNGGGGGGGGGGKRRPGSQKKRSSSRTNQKHRPTKL